MGHIINLSNNNFSIPSTGAHRLYLVYYDISGVSPVNISYGVLISILLMACDVMEKLLLLKLIICPIHYLVILSVSWDIYILTNILNKGFRLVLKLAVWFIYGTITWFCLINFLLFSLFDYSYFSINTCCGTQTSWNICDNCLYFTLYFNVNN